MSEAPRGLDPLGRWARREVPKGAHWPLLPAMGKCTCESGWACGREGQELLIPQASGVLLAFEC